MTVHPLVTQLFAEVDRRKLSHRDITNATGLAPATLSHWRNGLRSPRLDDLDRLALYLGKTFHVT